MIRVYVDIAFYAKTVIHLHDIRKKVLKVIFVQIKL